MTDIPEAVCSIEPSGGIMQGPLFAIVQELPQPTHTTSQGMKPEVHYATHLSLFCNNY